MTTTERIANAIKHILEEDRRADRERIAELERDAAHMQLRVDLALCGDNELHATIDDLNRQLDEAHKENARLVLERDFYKGAAPSAMQAAAPGQTSTATGGVVDHAQEMMRRGISPELARAGAAFLDAVAPVVEEQGPWVVYDFAAPFGECYGGECGVGDAPYWKHSVNDCRPYEDKQAAEDAMTLSNYAKTSRVITIAEARAIEAKRG